MNEQWIYFLINTNLLSNFSVNEEDGMNLGKLLLTISILTLLTACGGGGSGGIVAPPVQNTPSDSQVRAMASTELTSIKAQNHILGFLLASLPMPTFQGSSVFNVNNLCSHGGMAALSYTDNDHNNLPSASDTYRIVYSNCIDSNGDTYVSGYIDGTITNAGAAFPDFSTGNGVFTSDWSLNESVSFHDMAIRDGLTGVTEKDNGILTVNAGNDLATSSYHSGLSSDNLNSADGSGSGTYIGYSNLWFNFLLNTATLDYSLDHDFVADITYGSTTSRLIYTNDPAFSGKLITLSNLFVPPKAGGLHIIWAGFKEVTVVAQPDGLNALVDIVGDNVPASLISWASIGLN